MRRCWGSVGADGEYISESVLSSSEEVKERKAPHDCTRVESNTAIKAVFRCSDAGGAIAL